MIFAKNFARFYEKKILEHQTLGRRVICPIEPVYCIVDWRILEVVMEEMTNAQLVRLDKRIDGQVYFFFQGFRHGYFAASNREG